ncbi:MAG TPA: hypothetical protein VGN97_21855 [Mesorhizobium sp.]|nr:hypothetical protein [Mesorhizobium sp.]
MTFEQLIESGRFAVRSLLKVQFGEGTYGFWNGTFDLDWNGLTYRPNQLISVEEPGAGMGMAASGFTVSLPERADFGVTPDILAQIEAMDYKGRPVTVYDAYFDPDTRALVHVEPMIAGYADTIDHVQSAGLRRLVGRAETTALDNHRDGYRSASHEDQQLVSPGDRGFEHASRVKSEHFDIKFD